jgi:hypothetical protein
MGIKLPGTSKTFITELPLKTAIRLQRILQKNGGVALFLPKVRFAQPKKWRFHLQVFHRDHPKNKRFPFEGVQL